MLMPLPATLRRLVKEYETLLAEETLSGATAPSPALQDLAYTLCVSTGTREVTQALEAARSYLGTEEVWPAPRASAPRASAPRASAADRAPLAEVRMREVRMPETSVG
ncbi:DUF5133 domain-containing protein [Streptomyces sp. IBSBF 3136]|uniref:DUF5133 domain-containing protein n=1 Tax=Streptomyces sp. IBSBF 3136 TaxID=2903524 RepID=UPI002FDC28D6